MTRNFWLFDREKLTAKNPEEGRRPTIRSLIGTARPLLSGQIANEHKRGMEHLGSTEEGEVPKVVDELHGLRCAIPSSGGRPSGSKRRGLYVLDSSRRKMSILRFNLVDLTVVTDPCTLNQPCRETVSRLSRNAKHAHTAGRAYSSARDYSRCREHCIVRNLKRSSGVAERSPAGRDAQNSIALMEWMPRRI